jgi:hypothetical protein
MASNENNVMHKMEEEVMVRKRLRLSDDDAGNDDSSDSLEVDEEEEKGEGEEETTEVEVSSKEMSTPSRISCRRSAPAALSLVTTHPQKSPTLR